VAFLGFFDRHRIAPLCQRAQTQKGNEALALSCYQATPTIADTYRLADVEETTQLPFAWQGSGAGSPIVDPGVGSVNEAREVKAFVLAGANDAVAKPTIATDNAKKRTVAFIFSNLIQLRLKETSPSVEPDCTRFSNTSPLFSYEY